jgi:hypothetical protein
MFITATRHKLSLPTGLATPSVLYWRTFDLPGAFPWFLASFLIGDGADAYVETSGIFWEEDLGGRLQQKPDDKLVNLQFLVPPAASHGPWFMRTVQSVWRGTHRTTGAEVFVLQDDEGKHFLANAEGFGLADVIERELIKSIELP